MYTIVSTGSSSGRILTIFLGGDEHQELHTIELLNTAGLPDTSYHSHYYYLVLYNIL